MAVVVGVVNSVKALWEGRIRQRKEEQKEQEELRKRRKERSGFTTLIFKVTRSRPVTPS